MNMTAIIFMFIPPLILKELSMNIEGSIALVTGANRGLGAAFVRALLAGGAAKVYAAARNPGECQAGRRGAGRARRD